MKVSRSLLDEVDMLLRYSAELAHRAQGEPNLATKLTRLVDALSAALQAENLLEATLLGVVVAAQPVPPPDPSMVN